MLQWWPGHQRHLLAYILGLRGNVLGGCGLFIAWLPDGRVSESLLTTDRSFCQMIQTYFDLSELREVL